MPLQREGRNARVICLAALLAGCTAALPPPQAGPCPPTRGAPMLAFELFFGRSIQGQSEVSDSAWEDFLNTTVTRNLPNGYTVFDGTGAWLNPASKSTVHERTKVLLAALPDTPANAAAIERVRQAYAAQYHQVLVGMMVTPVCGAF